MSSTCPTRRDRRPFSPGPRGRFQGFTLIEVLVASVIFTLLLVLAMSVLGQASSVWRRSADRVEAFQSARLGFDLLTRNLSQATLNTYYDYFNNAGQTVAEAGTSVPFKPAWYGRQSELRFVTGPAGTEGLPGVLHSGTAVFFQAPLGYTEQANTYGKLQSTLNSCGYFIEFGTNKNIPAHARGNAPNPYRYRLMQLLNPTEKNMIYSNSRAPADDYNWIGNTENAQPISENIIALIVRPKDPSEETDSQYRILESDYLYNTKRNANSFDSSGKQPIWANQLPPVLQTTMIAVDETSAKRIDAGSTPPKAIENALMGKFENATRFEADLKDVKASLEAANIQYRVFDSAVPILESKWTK